MFLLDSARWKHNFTTDIDMQICPCYIDIPVRVCEIKLGIITQGQERFFYEKLSWMIFLQNTYSRFVQIVPAIR